MCARYTMGEVSTAQLIEALDLDAIPPALEPRYNIAPTEAAPIVIQSREGNRHLGLARFGLVPHWANDVKIGVRMLNARAESVADKPAFRDAFARHRCLVVADGFYEWKTEGKLKVPTWFHLPDRHVFAFAGLWAVWRNAEGERVTSFSILTREAEGSVRAIHDRMPVILRPEAYAGWLDRALTDPDAVRRVLTQERGAELVGHVVSRRVNKVGTDDPSLVEPAEE
jgi:putative SOS response-associated peptidase YedK